MTSTSAILTKRLRVLVLTPLGQGGKGGIDRLTDLLREAVRQMTKPELFVSFAATRGQGTFPVSATFFRTLFHAINAMGRRDVDVLHVMLSIRGSTYRKIIFCFIARLFSTPYVLHLNGSNYDEFWDRSPALMKRIIDTLFERSSAIIVTGRYWERAIVQRVPATAGRIRVMMNATNPGPPPSAERDSGANVIVFLGQIGERKGVPELIEALSLLRAVPFWTAVIAGDGAVEACRKQIETAGLGHLVSVPGWVNSADVSALLQRANIMVLPSREENLPVSIVEAFGHGVAVISTPVGAVPEILEHDRTGLIVPFRDPEALAAALRRLISDRELQRFLGENARMEHASRLALQPFMTRLIDLWANVARPAQQR